MPDLMGRPLLREMERIDQHDLRGCVEQLPGKWLHVGLWVALQQAEAEYASHRQETRLPHLATQIRDDLQISVMYSDTLERRLQRRDYVWALVHQLAIQSTESQGHHGHYHVDGGPHYTRPLWQFYTRWWDRMKRLAPVQLDADFQPMPGDDWPADCPLPKASAPLSGAALRSEIQDRGHRLAVEPIPGSRCYVMQGAAGSADAVVRVITAQGNCYTWEDDGTIGPFDVGECAPPTLVARVVRSVQSSPRGG